jgi:hypothetical protein
MMKSRSKSTSTTLFWRLTVVSHIRPERVRQPISAREMLAPHCLTPKALQNKARGRRYSGAPRVDMPH